MRPRGLIGVTVLGVGLACAASRTCEERLERLPVLPVVLGVDLVWAASRACEERLGRLERLPVPPDAMPGMTNLTERTETELRV